MMKSKYLLSTSIKKNQLGFTLVELMVALALSLLVVAASVSALLVSRQGFTSVDAASQLRDNARFATDFLTRLSVQSGFKDAIFVDSVGRNLFRSTGVSTDPDTAIFGFYNSLPGTTTDPLNVTATDPNNNDILVLRYQAGSRNTGSAPGSGLAESDNAMFNCAGVPQANTPESSSDFIENVLYVNTPTNAALEPSLMCRYRTSTGGAWQTGQPLVQGVESFKVLYGTDGVVPNKVPIAAAPLGTAPTGGQPDSIPERYLRADELTVAGNEAATKENWRRVRNLRIGMVIRSASGVLQAPEARKYYPFAPQATDAASAGNFSSPEIDVAATDTRLRQVVTFTVYLHNYQGI